MSKRLKVERKGEGEDKCHSSHLDRVEDLRGYRIVGEDVGNERTSGPPKIKGCWREYRRRLGNICAYTIVHFFWKLEISG